MDEYPTLLFENAKDWARWLRKNHAGAPGVWLRLKKKGSAITAVTYPEALEEALCWGWIDGQTKSLDADTFIQKFTPRRNGSMWSAVNRDKAIALIAVERMMPAGLAEVEKARTNGRWENAYSSALPPDFEEALARNAQAKAFYDSLDRMNRNVFHYRVQMVRRPETRIRKIAEFVAMLADGRKLIG